MEDSLIHIDSNDIICIFDVDGKTYCAMNDFDNPDGDEVCFGLVSEVYGNDDTKINVITSVSDNEIDKVIEAYDQKMAIFDEIDEIDMDEEEW